MYNLTVRVVIIDIDIDMDHEKTHTRIADNPSVHTASGTLYLAKAAKFITGFLKRLSINHENLDQIHQTANAMVKQSDIFDLPDRFNDAFSEDGWIATGSMSVDIMRTAIELHEAGRRQEAEETILAWFQKDTISLFAIQRAKKFNKATNRWHQLQEAMKLALEERYWAAVPLILIACDGFASDVLGTSPFKKGADLTVFDSIAGHPTSLPRLISKVTKGIRKSSDDKLNLPLRHGILHGQSLGYANRTVCMKAWLLMIALVEWAYDKASEDKRIRAQESASKMSLSEMASDLRKLQKDKRMMDEFKIRESRGPFADSLSESSPEYAIMDFLRCWKNQNYGKMAERCVNLSKQSMGKLAGQLRRDTEFVELQEFEVHVVRQTTVARVDAKVFVKAKTLAGIVEGEFALIAFRHSVDGDIVIADDEGKWLVQEACIYDVVHRKMINSESV